MAKQKVIHYKNLPTRLPIFQTVVAWLLLDRFKSIGWVAGMAWTLIGLLWIVAMIGMAKEESVELRELRKPEEPR